jgi:hypothetical protein
VQKYKPYGNWTFEEKNKLIAEGEVGLRPILNQSGDGTWNTYILQGRPFKFYK